MAYARATQMADRGPNPDLWMVTGGPRQLLKGLSIVFKKQCFVLPKLFSGKNA